MSRMLIDNYEMVSEIRPHQRRENRRMLPIGKAASKRPTVNPAELSAGAVGVTRLPIPGVPSAIGIDQPTGTPRRAFECWSPPGRKVSFSI